MSSSWHLASMMMVGRLDVVASSSPLQVWALREAGGNWTLALSCSSFMHSWGWDSGVLPRVTNSTAGWYPKWFQALEKVVWFLVNMAMFGILLLVLKGVYFQIHVSWFWREFSSVGFRMPRLSLWKVAGPGGWVLRFAMDFGWMPAVQGYLEDHPGWLYKYTK